MGSYGPNTSQGGSCITPAMAPPFSLWPQGCGNSRNTWYERVPWLDGRKEKGWGGGVLGPALTSPKKPEWEQEGCSQIRGQTSCPDKGHCGNGQPTLAVTYIYWPHTGRAQPGREEAGYLSWGGSGVLCSRRSHLHCLSLTQTRFT